MGGLCCEEPAPASWDSLACATNYPRHSLRLTTALLGHGLLAEVASTLGWLACGREGVGKAATVGKNLFGSLSGPSLSATFFSVVPCIPVLPLRPLESTPQYFDGIQVTFFPLKTSRSQQGAGNHRLHPR